MGLLLSARGRMSRRRGCGWGERGQAKERRGRGARSISDVCAFFLKTIASASVRRRRLSVSCGDRTHNAGIGSVGMHQRRYGEIGNGITQPHFTSPLALWCHQRCRRWGRGGGNAKANAAPAVHRRHAISTVGHVCLCCKKKRPPNRPANLLGTVGRGNHRSWNDWGWLHRRAGPLSLTRAVASARNGAITGDMARVGGLRLRGKGKRRRSFALRARPWVGHELGRDVVSCKATCPTEPRGAASATANPRLPSTRRRAANSCCGGLKMNAPIGARRGPLLLLLLKGPLVL